MSAGPHRDQATPTRTPPPTRAHARVHPRAGVRDPASPGAVQERVPRMPMWRHGPCTSDCSETLRSVGARPRRPARRVRRSQSSQLRTDHPDLDHSHVRCDAAVELDARTVPHPCRRAGRGRLGRGSGPALQRASTARVDLCGRGRPSDPSRPRPLRGGRSRPHRPRRPLHGARHPALVRVAGRHR